MTILSEGRVRELLSMFMGETPHPPELYAQLGAYLDLLMQWNRRTNLTAVREPEEIVRRHFGESLFLARHLPPAKTLLDYGSGAGFPGLPMQLLLPKLQVTLAESQGKKASFLREAVRCLGLQTEVWPDRVEAMEMTRSFDVVALRAVDKMDQAIRTASARVRPGGILALLVSGTEDGLPIPGAHNRVVRFLS